MQDLMNGEDRITTKVHDHGFIALVDVMPRLVEEGTTADAAIVQAARVSYGEGTKTVSEDAGLINYLMRHRHSTPFEMVQFKFHVKLPIFVARQWMRHRTWSYNEVSARYSKMSKEQYTPASLRRQGGPTKQTSEKSDEWCDKDIYDAIDDTYATSGNSYEYLLQGGVARELARIVLPVAQYTEFYGSIDLHNLLHFLSLRIDSHAQQEIQDYANAMYELIEPIVPLTMKAFKRYRLNGIHLTELEVEALANGRPTIHTNNKREQAEWEAKRIRLNFHAPL